MGRPKHLIEQDGRTWLEATVTTLQSQVDRVVISGAGTVPERLAQLPVVEDVKGLAGPLAGILAVFRRFPDVSWLVVACDLPHLRGAALSWLLSCRQPGVRAVLPDLEGEGNVEPLLAWYGRNMRDVLEQQAAASILKLRALAGKPGVISPRPPAGLRRSWVNINTPEKLILPDNGCQNPF